MRGSRSGVGAVLRALGTVSIEVRNFAVVTYAVPADRVRARLPAVYDLETILGDDGELALVSATCFCNGDFRWSALPYPRLTFDESTYRTYVTHRGRRGVYFFKRYLGSPLALPPQRAVEMSASLARFDVETKLDESGYAAYSCRVQGRDEENSFSIRAGDDPVARAPFDTGEEMAQHITYRLHGFFTTSAGFQGHMPVSHARMAPWAGELVSARFDTLARLGILEEEELRHPYCVLVQPLIAFDLHPPRPLLP
jgi:uncharacterized protein YqjF (DUF2071 family)